jgi:hypothetical protein
LGGILAVSEAGILNMADLKKNERLSVREERDLVIQAGIQSIPYIGGSLATLYFGRKQELRFKRLETFYKEIAEEVRDIKDKIAPPETHDREAFAAIFEELNERIEREQVQEKREFLKAYLKNILIYPIKENNYDERHFFLDTLGSMSLLECELLGYLYKKTKPVKVGTLQKPGVDQYAIVGAVGRLKTYGFLVSGQAGINIGGGEDNILLKIVKVSDFGRRFCEFCLRT